MLVYKHCAFLGSIIGFGHRRNLRTSAIDFNSDSFQLLKPLLSDGVKCSNIWMAHVQLQKIINLFSILSFAQDYIWCCMYNSTGCGEKKKRGLSLSYLQTPQPELQKIVSCHNLAFIYLKTIVNPPYPDCSQKKRVVGTGCPYNSRRRSQRRMCLLLFCHPLILWVLLFIQVVVPFAWCSFTS